MKRSSLKWRPLMEMMVMLIEVAMGVLIEVAVVVMFEFV